MKLGYFPVWMGVGHCCVVTFAQGTGRQRGNVPAVLTGTAPSVVLWGFLLARYLAQRCTYKRRALKTAAGQLFLGFMVVILPGHACRPSHS